MEKNKFYICEEDNVFDDLIDMYEDLSSGPYANCSELDPNLGWYEEEIIVEYSEDSEEQHLNEDSYKSYALDVDCGDIVLASVYQEAQGKNLKHSCRPFLIIYANAHSAYGFQLGTSFPTTLLDYRVEVTNYKACGLNGSGAVFLNMVRGVSQDDLIKYIGRMDNTLKEDILSKLEEIKQNIDGKYDDCPLRKDNHLETTIKNIKRIKC